MKRYYKTEDGSLAEVDSFYYVALEHHLGPFVLIGPEANKLLIATYRFEQSNVNLLLNCQLPIVRDFYRHCHIVFHMDRFNTLDSRSIALGIAPEFERGLAHSAATDRCFFITSHETARPDDRYMHYISYGEFSVDVLLRTLVLHVKHMKSLNTAVEINFFN